MRPVNRTLLGDIVRHVIAFVLLVIFLFPIYWMISTSVKPTEDILSRPPVWTFTPILDHYRFAFTEANFGLFIKNTLIVATGSTFIVILVGSLAAYSFARYSPGEGHIMVFILTTRMMPGIAVVIPFFVLFRELGKTPIGQALFLGLDQPGALIVAHTVFNLPFAIWLMHSFFQDIPLEIEESAKLDGCNRLQVLRHIIFPLGAPGVAVTAIFSFLFSWNEFLFANVLTRDAAKTITVGVSGFQTQQGILWGPLAAAATICVIPTLLLVFFMQRYMVRGLTFGAVKG